MAIVKDGINGPFSGKVGSVVGSSWRKVNYIKGFSKKVKKEHVPSAKQALQRQKFASLNRFLDPLSGLLEIGFGSFTGRATGRNAAFSYNYDHAFSVSGTDVQLNYPALRFSHGSLFTAGDERAWRAGDSVHVSWDASTYGIGGAMDDVAYLVVYEEVNEIFLDYTTALRNEGSAEITIPKIRLNPPKLHLWLVFADKLGKQVSKTVYIPIAAED